MSRVGSLMQLVHDSQREAHLKLPLLCYSVYKPHSIPHQILPTPPPYTLGICSILAHLANVCTSQTTCAISHRQDLPFHLDGPLFNHLSVSLENCYLPVKPPIRYCILEELENSCWTTIEYFL